MRELVIFLNLVLLNGCGLVTQESFYEGLRTNQKAKADRSSDNSKELPSYEQYRQERETQKK
jgi:hypothetical protein